MRNVHHHKKTFNFCPGFEVDKTRDGELMMITGDNTRITKLSSATDIIGAIASVKNIMESVSKFHFAYAIVTSAIHRIDCVSIIF